MTGPSWYWRRGRLQLLTLPAGYGWKSRKLIQRAAGGGGGPSYRRGCCVRARVGGPSLIVVWR